MCSQGRQLTKISEKCRQADIFKFKLTQNRKCCMIGYICVLHFIFKYVGRSAYREDAGRRKILMLVSKGKSRKDDDRIAENGKKSGGGTRKDVGRLKSRKDVRK